jgi:hypothetical protein
LPARDTSRHWLRVHAQRDLFFQAVRKFLDGKFAKLFFRFKAGYEPAVVIGTPDDCSAGTVGLTFTR